MQNDAKPLHIAIILVAGSIAYLSALLTGFLGLDDVGLLRGLISSEFSVKRLLFSGAGEYFRPMPFISYALDVHIAGLNSAWFHGVNVAIHLINGVLVYWLALLYLREESEQNSYLALTAALFFTLHPLNTEAVMWISARPDLLCCFFSLISLIQVIQIKESPKAFSLICLFIIYLCSLLSKEVSIILVFVVPLYLVFGSKDRDLMKSLRMSSVFFTAAILYLFMRGGKSITLDNGITKLVTNVVTTKQDTSIHFEPIAAYGFYLKKLIYPFPLNFAIVNFNKNIAFMVLFLAIIIAVILFYRNRLSRLPLLIIFLGIILPVGAYLGKLPWTPFAERYLYLSMVGMSLLIPVLFLYLHKIPRILPVSLMLFFAIPTIARVNTWADPLAFWGDVVAKSPRFSRSYVCLAAALIDAQDYDAAEKNLKMALAMGYDQRPLWQNLAQVYLLKREYVNYENAMMRLIDVSKDPTEVYQKIIENLVKIPNNEIDRKTINKKVIAYYKKAIEKNPSYNLAYYNIGKLYWSMGDNDKALYYLKLFADKAKSDPMRPFALKIISKIHAVEILKNKSLTKSTLD